MNKELVYRIVKTSLTGRVLISEEKLINESDDVLPESEDIVKIHAFS